MDDRSSLYGAVASLLSYVLKCGVVAAVTVVAIQYGIAPALDRLFTQISANILGAM